MSEDEAPHGGHPPIEAGADHVHAHPRPTGHRWFDITMAVSAIFISAVSLAVAVEHGRTERDLVAANSWPFLRAELQNDYQGGKAYVMGVSNGGVGPAKIRSVEVSLDGRWVASPLELLSRCCGLPRTNVAIKQALPNGLSMSSVDQTVLRPGERDDILVVPVAGTSPALLRGFGDALHRVRFIACYCSVLDQCWTSDLVDTDTRPVAACPTPAHPYRYDAGGPR